MAIEQDVIQEGTRVQGFKGSSERKKDIYQTI